MNYLMNEEPLGSPFIDSPEFTRQKCITLHIELSGIGLSRGTGKSINCRSDLYIDKT